MKKVFYIVKESRNGDVQYRFGSGNGPPVLGKGDEIVVMKKDNHKEVPAWRVHLIQEEFRNYARARGIPYVINLDARS